MVVYKRFVILNEVDASTVSGIVKFENFNNKTSCEFRINNISGDVDVGFNINNEIKFINVKESKLIDLDKQYDLSSLIQIILIQNDIVLAQGSTNGVNMSYIKLLKEYGVLKDKRKLQIENAEPIIIENVNSKTIKEEIIETKINEKNQEQPNFYNKVKTQLKELFDKHIKDEELESMIVDSKWVRVNTVNDDYYVVGIIFNDNVPSLICYGVPDKDDKNPPQNNENCMQWLKINDSKGYWLMYQSAVDGKTLTLDELY